MSRLLFVAEIAPDAVPNSKTIDRARSFCHGARLMPPFEFAVVNYWSEVKLDIIKDYARAYSTILAKQPWCKGHFYIDAFAGAGMHISRPLANSSLAVRSMLSTQSLLSAIII